jgi:hypothetical protein
MSTKENTVESKISTLQDLNEQEIEDQLEIKNTTAIQVEVNNFFGIMKDKIGFLVSVYLVIIVQILISLYSLYLCNSKNPLSKYLLWNNIQYTVYFLFSVLLLYVPIPNQLKLFQLLITSFVQGGFLYMLSNTLKIKKINIVNLVEQGLISGIVIYLSFALATYSISNFDIEISIETIFIITSILCILLGIGIGYIIKSPSIYHTILLIVGLLAFSYYIIYNTNRVIKENITDVWKAAVKFYVNFLNIMIQTILMIFNKKEEQKGL